jgi:predicted TPR repeat methyltransferase
MSDPFRDKAADWDQRPVPVQISEGVSRHLLGAIRFEPGMAVMDFGAGTGLLASRIAPHAERLLAIDVSEAMLEQLAKKPELAGKVTSHCRDILSAPLDEKVDLVVSAMAMHHIEDTEALFAAFHAHLVPGGRVALADLDTEPGTFHPPGTEGVFHAGFDRDRLRALLEEAGFVDVAFVTACEVDRDERRYSIFLVTATKA